MKANDAPQRTVTATAVAISVPFVVLGAQESPRFSRKQKTSNLTIMAHYALYAYAIGLEFSAIAEQVIERVNHFIASQQWRCSDVWAVNQQRSAEDWELGLNLSLPDPDHEPPDWFSDVEAVVRFCIELRGEFHHDFTIGITDARTGCGEDIIEVGSEPPDYNFLRRFIGVRPPTP